MKTSFISTASMSQALRYQMMRLQSELVQSQNEATTSRLSDPGAVLGARAGTTFSMARDIERLEGLVDANSMAASRLAATQDGLEQLHGLGEKLLTTLTTAPNMEAPQTIAEEARRSLETMTGILNTSVNGEHLFAGINTDTKPINDFTDPASANKQGFDTLFQSHFGFTQTDPAAAGITAAEMNAFLDEVETYFMGSGWDDWSNASDRKITSRITLNETSETSITANEAGIRRIAMTAAVLTDLMKVPLSENARTALYERGTQFVGQAIADVAHIQSEVGLAEQRVSDASERISSQVDLFKTMITDLEGVDPYEAATKVNELLTQIETSYALTARIQQLSLLRYLP
ncbi:flagellar hook-associated family protein [Chelativorans sp. M5D2P16]|uniref:flagellar hook-associated family protein n=1 Tax=Chelativorans sp. M5D2P16 TaxID=3095678 RepID=UPI002ACA4026|nr:flagellar hook-associated family protein [Chelativorans sp. M5D2P16]MDZ5698460.1 flagellar hook-associated family protein [Chelativorans sp. M5D2P16]